MRILISQPSQVTFDATKAGNFHFVAELMRSYPDIMWEVDDKNRSIIHIAVLHRHSSIFNLIHEIGSIKDLIVTFEEKDEKNNMLHCAAKLAPPHQLKLISGAALQMTHEVLWFEVFFPQLHTTYNGLYVISYLSNMFCMIAFDIHLNHGDL